MAPVETLRALGFTELEARLYCELLRSSPASGYRLAQAVGKAAANAYQGLASLVQKGAVLVDDGVTRAYRPVPPRELLARLSRTLDERLARAETELTRIESPPGDDRLYHIGDQDQLYERALAMVREAGDILLFDLFPAPFARLRKALLDAARRGVVVAGLVYEPGLEALPFRALLAAGAPHLDERWPGQQLSLVADAQEHLVALLSHQEERVLHGAWSNSAYLSSLQHNGLASEIRLLAAFPNEDDPLAALGLLAAFPAGLRALVSPVPAADKEDA